MRGAGIAVLAGVLGLICLVAIAIAVAPPAAP